MDNNRILNDIQFEGHRFYEPESRLNKIISEKIREVFIKLFQNTDVNLDDFYFTGYDDETPNAFMIDKSDTNSKKYIIAVSNGLFKRISCIEEFAAIIAHECGHVIWAELIGGKNTIIQERSSDVNSVDMMINAGYNPRYVISAQKLIFSRYSDNKNVSFDVHGDPYHRIQDVEAYLTKIAAEKGNFPKLRHKKDIDWINFVSDVEKIHTQDGYDTFIDRKLKQKFGTKDLTKLNRLDVLKLFLQNIDNIVGMDVRFLDLTEKLSQFDFSEKSDEETKILQDLFLIIHEKHSSGHVNYFFKQGIYYDNLESMLGRFYLKSFGPFQEQFENIENFIKYYDDRDKAIFYAEKIEKLIWTLRYWKKINGLKFPSFRPLGQDNVGKMLPWDKLVSYNNAHINIIYPQLCETRKIFYQDVYSVVKDYDEKDYFCDKDGIVIAYGPRARQLYEQRERHIKQEQFDNSLKYDTDVVRGCINRFDSLIKYINGEMPYQEFVENYVVNIGVSDFFGLFFDAFGRLFKHQSWADDIEKYKIDYSGYRDLYNEILNSVFYKKFIAGSEDIKLYPDFTNYADVNYLISRIQILINPASFENFDNFIMQSLLKLLDDMTKYGTNNHKQIAALLYKNFLSTSPRSPWIKYDEKFLTDDSLLILAHRDAKCDDIKKQNKQYKQIYLKQAVNNYAFSISFPDELKELIEKELSENSESLVVFDMMKSIGIPVIPKDSDDLIYVLNYMYGLGVEEYDSNASMRYFGRMASKHIGGDPISNEISHYIRYISHVGDENISQLMYILVAEYLRGGNKINPMDILPYFKNRKNENIVDSVRDIFGKYITVADFNKLSIMDKIKLFEFMDYRNLFSEKLANKNAFIKIIANEVINHPDKDFIAKEVVEKILTRHAVTEYGEPVSKRDFEFADEREKFIEFYSEYWAKKLGRDDGSDEYLNRVKEFTDFITSIVRTKDNRGYIQEENRLFSQMISEEILNNVSNKVIAQERAAKMFGDAARMRVNADKVNRYDYFGRGADIVFSALAKTPERALATIKFLNEKISDESVQRIINECGKNLNKQEQNLINKQTLTIIHENFWSADLPVRAYVMNRLLGAYTTQDSKKLKLVVDSYFKKDSTYYNDAVIVLESVYQNLEDYERGLILSALLASGQNEDNTSITNGQQVGRGLKMFFQAKGGAFIKFGQLLSYLPSLDSDIRRELATLREKANIPTRDELFDMMRTSLPESEFNKISYVGEILGGGSIYISVHVKYDGRDCVIALMRPNTRKLMFDGITMISKSVDDMSDKDKKFAQLRNIVTQAKLSCESEVDIDQDYEKYMRAINIYESLHVKTPNADYSPDVARWFGYGADAEKNNAYKIMEMAPGKSLSSSDIDEDEKHDFAVAYVALELSILLSGARWDTDRHAGQQNFYNSNFRDFCIGIFDTGAQMSNEPSRRDKIMLGHLVYELIRGARSGRGISEILNKKIKNIDSIGKSFGLSTEYIDGVQRGLIALSDIIEYQKEIKDEDGNVIQECKTLSENDLENIIVAILDSGIIDKTVMHTVRAKAILNKLRILRPGWFKTLGEGIKKQSSVISIKYIGEKKHIPRIEMIKKSLIELNNLMRSKMARKHLGIDTDLIVKSKDDAERA